MATATSVRGRIVMSFQVDGFEHLLLVPRSGLPCLLNLGRGECGCLLSCFWASWVRTCPFGPGLCSWEAQPAPGAGRRGASFSPGGRARALWSAKPSSQPLVRHLILTRKLARVSTNRTSLIGGQKLESRVQGAGSAGLTAASSGSFAQLGTWQVLKEPLLGG